MTNDWLTALDSATRALRRWGRSGGRAKREPCFGGRATSQELGDFFQLRRAERKIMSYRESPFKRIRSGGSLGGLQCNAIELTAAIAEIVLQRKYTCYACAIMPDLLGFSRSRAHLATFPDALLRATLGSDGPDTRTTRRGTFLST